jgi:type VI secretion system protein ImpG
VHHKIEDEFPELTEALLGVLYPHYLAPVPSMGVVEFVQDPEKVQMTGAHRIERLASIYSQPVSGTPCRFRTCYPVTLWPMEVASATLDVPDRVGPSPKAVGVIRIELRCLGDAKLHELELDQLRFYLHGESQLTYALYELLFGNATQVQLRPLAGQKSLPPVVLPPRCLRPVGFAPDEGMLHYTARSFLGYRLLQEYFSFPEKFLFFDVGELDEAAQAGFKEGMEIAIFLDRMPRFEQPITAGTFRLGCTPIINLFEQIAEPIRVSHARTEYQVLPDLRRPEHIEVYAVESVTSTSPHLEEPIVFQPFYSFKHATDRERQQAFWYAARRPSPKKGDPGTEVHLSFVDFNFRPTLPAAETLTIHTTCLNRDLPGKLPFGGAQGDFELEGATPLSRIHCLTKPTPTARPPQRRGGQWRLISHLALNYLSICDGGREALQEILMLYDFGDSPVIRQQIAGITNVTSRRVVRRPGSMPWNGFCRGIEVTMEFDEAKFVGTGAFLFASVLEKFLGLYASLNSFSQLVATTKQRKEALKRWPPRAGEQILL